MFTQQFCRPTRTEAVHACLALQARGAGWPLQERVLAHVVAPGNRLIYDRRHFIIIKNNYTKYIYLYIFERA